MAMKNKAYDIQTVNQVQVGGGSILIWMTILLLLYEDKFNQDGCFICETYNSKNKGMSSEFHYTQEYKYDEESYLSAASNKLQRLLQKSIMDKMFKLCHLKFWKCRISCGIGNTIDAYKNNKKMMIGMNIGKLNRLRYNTINYSCLNLGSMLGGHNVSSKIGGRLLTGKNKHIPNENNSYVMTDEMSEYINEEESLLGRGCISRPIYLQTYLNSARYSANENSHGKNNNNASFATLFLSSTLHRDLYANSIDISAHSNKLIEYSKKADFNCDKFRMSPGFRIEATRIISNECQINDSYEAWIQKFLKQCLKSNIDIISNHAFCLPLNDICNYISITQGTVIGAYRIGLDLLPKTVSVPDSFSIQNMVFSCATFLCTFYRGLANTKIENKNEKLKLYLSHLSKFLGRGEYGLLPPIPRAYYKYFESLLGIQINVLKFMERNNIMLIKPIDEETLNKRMKMLSNFLNREGKNLKHECFKCGNIECNKYFITNIELQQHLQLNDSHKSANINKVTITKEIAKDIMDKIDNAINKTEEYKIPNAIFSKGHSINILGKSGTGKTYFLRLLLLKSRWLYNDEEIIVLGPTRVSINQATGHGLDHAYTFHSLFGCSEDLIINYAEDDNQTLRKLTPELKKKLKTVKIIFIDESGQVPRYIFDQLILFLKTAKNAHTSIKGLENIQIVCSGGLTQ